MTRAEIIAELRRNAGTANPFELLALFSWLTLIGHKLPHENFRRMTQVEKQNYCLIVAESLA